MNGFKDEGVGDEGQYEREDAGIAVRGDGDRVGNVAVVTVGCPSRLDEVDSAAVLFSGGAKSKNWIKANSSGIPLGKMEDCCVGQRREINLETQLTGRKLGE